MKLFHVAGLVTTCLLPVTSLWGQTDLERTAGPAKGPWRRLFFEERSVVEASQGLQSVFHPMRKHPRNPLFGKDHDWEGTGPYLFGSVFREDGRWRMWYQHWSPSQPYFNSYAESTDGLHWEKPALGICEWEGSRDNNLVFTRKDEGPQKYRHYGEAHNMSVMLNPFSDDPATKYICFFFSLPYLRARWAYSADGYRFTSDPRSREMTLFQTNDVMNVTYDPYKRRFIAARKRGNAKGRAVAIAWSYDGLKWEWPTFTETYTRPDGIEARRDTVIGADEKDPSAMQVYGMPLFAYQGLVRGAAVDVRALLGGRGRGHHSRRTGVEHRSGQLAPHARTQAAHCARAAGRVRCRHDFHAKHPAARGRRRALAVLRRLERPPW